jgi:hypothetical protein
MQKAGTITVPPFYLVPTNLQISDYNIAQMAKDTNPAK